MNKDTVILKHQQETVADIETEVAELHSSGEDQAQRLAAMQERLAEVGAKSKNRRRFSRAQKKSDVLVLKENAIDPLPASYEDLYTEAKASLLERGIDPGALDYGDLVSKEELEQIVEELNSSLPREEKWTKADFIVVFIAAIIGGVADFILSNRSNNATGQQSRFSEWLNNTFHEGKHATNAPIDYQGKGFGGGYHRELSKGHDIVRFVEGIKMFKNGTFEGVRYIDGVAHKVVMTANQYGNPYSQLSTIEAILGYAEHMFADLFSKVSLPFPGYSFFAESSNRDLRKFAADMYHNGFNCKNIIIQSVSTIAVEVIIRIYFSIESVKKYHDKCEVAEDYSNFEAIKQFVTPGGKEKLHEMLLVAHLIVVAVNAGKIVITKNLAEINVTEILAVVRYGASVLSALQKRNDEYAKLIFHSKRIDELWSKLDGAILEEETALIENYPTSLVIS